MSTSLTPQQRFWAKVEKTETCWLWTGYRDRGGYGQFSVDGKQRKPHRVAYEWTVGPIPEGLQLDHLCRVRHCVRPDHLEPVTCAENLRRGHGFVGINSRKTHCKRGHPLTPDNLVPRKDGNRACRICWRETGRRYEAKKRQQP